MATRIVEWKKPYTWGKAISIDENKVISLNLRDENNLIIYDEWDDEIYVDLQLDDEITPTDAFPIWVNVGRVIVDNWWDKPWTIISAVTTSWDNIKIFYADEWTLWMDNWTWTFKQIYFKADVDALLLALRNYIDWELAKKQNWVSSDTAPSNPSEWDLWYDTTSSSMKVWDWTAWQSVGWWDVLVSDQANNIFTPWMKIWGGTEWDFNNLTPDSNTAYLLTAGWPTPWWWQPWPNTIAYFPLDTDLLDHSGNSFSATIRGNVSIWTAWWISAGYFWDIWELSWAVTITGSVTVLGYAYKTGNPNYDNASMFGFAWWWSMGWPVCQALYWNTNWPANISNKPWVALFDWDTQANQTAVSMNNNEWTHFAATLDWSTKEVKLYTNWVLSSQYTSSATTLPNYLWMSRNDWLDRSWIGYFSNVIFESKCWTATEISDYFNQTKWDYWIS